MTLSGSNSTGFYSILPPKEYKGLLAEIIWEWDDAAFTPHKVPVTNQNLILPMFSQGNYRVYWANLHSMGDPKAPGLDSLHQAWMLVPGEGPVTLPTSPHGGTSYKPSCEDHLQASRAEMKMAVVLLRGTSAQKSRSPRNETCAWCMEAESKRSVGRASLGIMHWE